MALLQRRNRNRNPLMRRREPGTLALRDQMNDMFEDFFRDFARPWAGTALSPASEFIPTVDVTESDGQINVSAELPGMTEDDVNVELDEDTLTLSGEKKQEETDEEGGRYWRESSYGRFVREIPLPAAADVDNANASFKNGRLVVSLPKSEEEKAKRRQIPVNAG